ncbi:MAG: aconitate hydratase, partial [Peptostreptococcaceae bacterium]
PMTFINSYDYDRLDELDELEISDMIDALDKGIVTVINKTKNTSFLIRVELSEKEIEIIKFGGKLNYYKSFIKY